MRSLLLIPFSKTLVHGSHTLSMGATTELLCLLLPRYFLRAGLSPDDTTTHFVFALDAALSEKEMVELPPLPPNAQWVKPPQQCWTLGTLGWVLFGSRAVNVEEYR